MEKLKALFGSEALTWEQLEEKLKDNKDVKIANLAAGSHDPYRGQKCRA